MSSASSTYENLPRNLQISSSGFILWELKDFQRFECFDHHHAGLKRLISLIFVDLQNFLKRSKPSSDSMDSKLSKISELMRVYQ